MNELKIQLRKTYQHLRAEQPLAAQIEHSNQVCQQIQALDVYQQAQIIALYQSTRSEINLNYLWLHVHYLHKKCYFPAINNNKKLLFLPAQPGDSMKLNQFHIAEPKICETFAISLENIDLMLIPLLAFDPHGNRLGYGGGYYDRALSTNRPKCLLGVAFACQAHDNLPTDPWDIVLDGVVTEHGVHWVN